MQGNGAGPGMAYLHGSLLLDGGPHQGCPVCPMPGSFPAHLPSACPAAVCLVQYLGNSLPAFPQPCMPHALNRTCHDLTDLAEGRADEGQGIGDLQQCYCTHDHSDIVSMAMLSWQQLEVLQPS